MVHFYFVKHRYGRAESDSWKKHSLNVGCKVQICLVLMHVNLLQSLLEINRCTVERGTPSAQPFTQTNPPTWLDVWTQPGKSQSLFIHHTVASKGQLLSELNHLQQRWHFRELSDKRVIPAKVFPSYIPESRRDACLHCSFHSDAGQVV